VRIVMGCRNADTAAAAVDEVRRRCGHDRVETRSLDLADLDHVRRFAASLSDLDRIDVLINNAGLMLDQRQESAQGHEATFAINHLGPFLLTSLLTEQVVAAPRGRIVNVASFAHQLAPRGIDWADIERRRHYRGWIVYGQSKLANILFTTELARRLAGSGVTANSLHPGSVASGFGRDGDLHGSTTGCCGSVDCADHARGRRLHLGAPGVVGRCPAPPATTGLLLAGRFPRGPLRRAGRVELWRRSEQMISG
jgi:NAD(P)-dependent dehydrogenase (short-subunit alcohol dehydrogenase family)